jgi:hypothetical protein
MIEVRRLSAEEATIEQVVEALVGTGRDTEVEHVFVDLAEIATGRNSPAGSDPRGHDAVPPPIPEPKITSGKGAPIGASPARASRESRAQSQEEET